jgi:hypothetical protein
MPLEPILQEIIDTAKTIARNSGHRMFDAFTGDKVTIVRNIISIWDNDGQEKAIIEPYEDDVIIYSCDAVDVKDILDDIFAQQQAKV